MDPNLGVPFGEEQAYREDGCLGEDCLSGLQRRKREAAQETRENQRGLQPADCDVYAHAERLCGTAAKLPTKFQTEWLWSCCLVCEVDLTPGQGEFAKACVEMRTPVLCFGLAEKHNKCLGERLTHWVVTLPKFNPYKAPEP